MLKPTATAGISGLQVGNDCRRTEYSESETVDVSKAHSKARIDKNIGLQKRLRRLIGVLLNSQYHNAIHILSKITKNKEDGTADKWNENELVKYRKF